MALSRNIEKQARNCQNSGKQSKCYSNQADVCITTSKAMYALVLTPYQLIFFPPLQFLATTNQLSLQISLFWKLIKKIHRNESLYLLFLWPASLTWYTVYKVPLCYSMHDACFLFMARYSTIWMYIFCLSIYLFLDVYVIST